MWRCLRRLKSNSSKSYLIKFVDTYTVFCAKFALIAHTCVSGKGDGSGKWFGRGLWSLLRDSSKINALYLLWRRRFLNMVRVVPYPDTLWFSRLSDSHLHHATTLKTSLLNPTSPFTMVISWALCWRLCQNRTLGENSHHEPSLTPDMYVTWRDCINYHPNPTGVPRPLTCTTQRVWSHLERSVSSKTEVKHTCVSHSCIRYVYKLFE